LSAQNKFYFVQKVLVERLFFGKTSIVDNYSKTEKKKENLGGKQRDFGDFSTRMSSVQNVFLRPNEDDMKSRMKFISFLNMRRIHISIIRCDILKTNISVIIV